VERDRGRQAEFTERRETIGVHDAVAKVILGADLPDDAKAKALSAFTKLLWIQKDLFDKHYIKD